MPHVRVEVITPGGGQEVRLCFAPHLRHRITVHSGLTPDEVATTLARCAVLLSASVYEGFGMATAEAMACGCALVTTRVGFGGELADGVEAFVCPVGDVDCLTDRVIRLLSTPTLRARMAESGRARVQNLSWAKQVKALESLYERWLRDWAHGAQSVSARESNVTAT